MKVAFETLGCKVNQYETEAMRALFVGAGYTPVDFDEAADVYVINTCTVTNLGDRKSRQMIRRATRKNPDAVVVVTGCYAQTAPDEVKAIEGVRLVLGTRHRDRVVELVESLAENECRVEVETITHNRDFEALGVEVYHDRTRAFLKIQDGCDRYCSYCIIPYARGPVRSRPLPEIVAEAEKLRDNGCRELVLSGIHVASYGKDFKDGTDLFSVIDALEQTAGIERIRMSSVEPVWVNEKLTESASRWTKLCDHQHLSLQSGCDKILKKMNRRYTTADYEAAVHRLRELYPDIAITTDIIVGFPEETEEDFLETMAFAERIGFAQIHVFPYSPRKGTPAADNPHQVDGNVKNDRAARLGALAEKLHKKFLTAQCGKCRDVLFEEKQQGYWIGHTSNYQKVYVRSPQDLSGKIVPVRLESLYADGILGGVCIGEK